MCLCYKVLIHHQCAILGSFSLKSFNFKDKSLGKLHLQTQDGSVIQLLDTGIGKAFECTEEIYVLLLLTKYDRLSVTVEKAQINYI